MMHVKGNGNPIHRTFPSSYISCKLSHGMIWIVQKIQGRLYVVFNSFCSTIHNVYSHCSDEVRFDEVRSDEVRLSSYASAYDIQILYNILISIKTQISVKTEKIKIFEKAKSEKVSD